jgi:hypothetical protein
MDNSSLAHARISNECIPLIKIQRTQQQQGKKLNRTQQQTKNHLRECPEISSECRTPSRFSLTSRDLELSTSHTSGKSS